MAKDDLLVEQDGPVLVVTFNRPDRLNSLNDGIHEGLPLAWERARDPSVRSIVITGTGDRAFCTGMDLQENTVRGGHRNSENVDRSSVKSMRMTPLQCDVWKPVIVAVNGLCVAGALHFVCDADVVIASTNASFFDTHAMVGQVSALEPVGLLPRIGLGNALRMVTLGKAARWSAKDALRISLVDEVVEPDRLLGRAMELAMIAAKASPRTLELSKRTIWNALEVPMGEALQHGWEVLRAHHDHPDNKEGPRAFVERREPRWTVD